MEQTFVRQNGSQTNQETAGRNRELFENGENITVINNVRYGSRKTSLLVRLPFLALRGGRVSRLSGSPAAVTRSAERIRALESLSHQITTGKVSHRDALTISSRYGISCAGS